MVNLRSKHGVYSQCKANQTRQLLAPFPKGEGQSVKLDPNRPKIFSTRLRMLCTCLLNVRSFSVSALGLASHRGPVFDGHEAPKSD